MVAFNQIRRHANIIQVSYEYKRSEKDKLHLSLI